MRPALLLWIPGARATSPTRVLTSHSGLATSSAGGRQGPGGEVPGLCGRGSAQLGSPLPCLQYSLSTKRSSPDDGNDVSPYSLSPVSNKR